MVGVDRRLSRWHPLLLSNEDGRNSLGTSGCLCNPPWNLTGEEVLSSFLTMPSLTAIPTEHFPCSSTLCTIQHEWSKER